MIVNIQFIPMILWKALNAFTRGDDETALVLWNLVWKARWVWGEPEV